MALLDLINSVQDEISLARSSMVIGSTDPITRTLLALANREGKMIATDWQWTVLENEFTWTLVSGQPNYPVPPDLDRHIPQTDWDRSSRWQIIGPVTPQEWQFRKSGIVPSSVRRRFRVKGRQGSQFYLDPTPISSDAGLTMVLEYMSSSWASPQAWVTSTAFVANSYCSYNGNYYKTGAGGVTGATPPTWTTGAQSDGGVVWAFNTDPFDHFMADTDTTLVPQTCVELGVEWRFLRSKGMSTWISLKEEYNDAVARWSSKTRSASVIDLSGQCSYDWLINPGAIQDGNYPS